MGNDCGNSFVCSGGVMAFLDHLERAKVRNHGDSVSVYDRHGNFDGRGKITGIYRCTPTLYDVIMDDGDCLWALPDARLKAYLPVPDEEPKNIKDEI